MRNVEDVCKAFLLLLFSIFYYYLLFIIFSVLLPFAASNLILCYILSSHNMVPLVWIVCKIFFKPYNPVENASSYTWEGLILFRSAFAWKLTSFANGEKNLEA